MKRIRIIAIIAAIVTGITLYAFLVNIKKPETIVRKPVIVASVDIKEGQTITNEMIAEKMLPEEAILSQAAFDKDKLVGQVSSMDVNAGEQMLSSKVFRAGETKSGLSYTLDKGMRAFTVAVDQVTGVAGFIKPTDRVDVLAIIDINNVLSPAQFKKLMEKSSRAEDDQPAASQAPQTQSGQPLKLKFSMILLQNIKVLAVGQVMKEQSSDSAPAIVETVTLSVTPEQALRLNLVLSEGNVRLVLRSPGEGDLPDLEGVSVANLIDGEDIDILSLLGKLAPLITAGPSPTVSPKPSTSPEPTASPTATAGK